MLGFILFLSIAQVSNAFDCETENHSMDRLDTLIIPERYNISIHGINKTDMTFSATAKIYAKVVGQSISTAQLHLSSKCFIVSAEVSEAANVHTPVPNKRINCAVIKFDFVSDYKRGQKIVLTVRYRCQISPYSKGLPGIYYYHYDDEIMPTIATMFKPTGAHTLFPCLDQPDAKAKFTFHFHRNLLRNGSNVIVTNTQPQRDSDINSTYIIYETTPLMSTYMLGFAIGRFDQQNAIHNGVNVRVSYPRNFTPHNSIDFTLKYVQQHLRIMSEYIGRTYAMHKLDVVYIQSLHLTVAQFGLISLNLRVGASENYIKEKTIEGVVQQWFGGLVTGKTWEEVVFNEGFVGFLYSKAINQDYTKSPIGLCDVDNGDAKAKLYWELTCARHKVGNLFILLESVIGQGHFQEALQQYVNKFAYKNVDKFDLFDKLQMVVNSQRIVGWQNQPINVTAFFLSWLQSKYRPTVEVYVTTAGIELQQRSSQPGHNHQWYIPLKISVSGKELKWFWLRPNASLLLTKADGIGSDLNEINFNPRKYGYYEVDTDT